MIAVMTRRQVSNRQLRSMGIKPASSYHWRVLPGDVARVQVVLQEPFSAETFTATVESIEHHGHYTLVTYVRADDGEVCSGWLHHDGPPDWGIVEFRVVRAVPRPTPEPDEELRRRDDEDILVRLEAPSRCPRCRANYDWIPRDGWPCIVCRVEAEPA